MAATTPRTPVAPGMSIGCAALDLVELPPELVPSGRVPEEPAEVSPPAQVYTP